MIILRLDRMLAEHAIARLITRYVHLNDAGQWEDLAALYTQNGRMNRPTAPDSFTTGREAILAAFQARPPRHPEARRAPGKTRTARR